MELTDLQIPPGWRLATVRECCQIDNHLREPISAQVRKGKSGKYPYYGPTGVLDYIEDYRVDGEYALIGEDGDHFLKYDTYDMTLLVRGKFNVNNHAHLVRGVGDCTTEWFFHYFRRANLYQYITRQGAGRYKLNKASLEELPILVPTLPEQHKISQILGTWDIAIVRVEQLITGLQLRRKGLMQLLLTGQVQFPEFAVANTKLRTKYCSLPADWDYIPLGEIAYEVSARNTHGDDLPVLSCTKYEGLVDSLEYFGRQIFSKDTSTYKIVKRGQFAYATNHIEEGSIGYQDKFDAGLISPMYTVFATKGQVNDAFLYRLLKTELYRHIFEINTSGTVDRRGRLAWADFARITVPLPSLEEQRRIADFFAVADKEIELQTGYLYGLRQQKKGLMQRLLTGQVRVKVEDTLTT